MGRLSPNKILLLRTQITDLLVVQAFDPKEAIEENDYVFEPEEGLNYVLLVPVRGMRKPLSWNLSAMTLPELEATRQFFNRLFDLAEAVVIRRDKVAQDALAEGDDSFSRVYREVPQLIDRQRAFDAYREGIQHGPAGSADRHEHEGDSGREVRGGGPEVADSLPLDGGSQDDGSAAH